MHSEYMIDTARLFRRINNKRPKHQRMLKIGKEVKQDDITMAKN